MDFLAVQVRRREGNAEEAHLCLTWKLFSSQAIFAKPMPCAVRPQLQAKYLYASLHRWAPLHGRKKTLATIT